MRIDARKADRVAARRARRVPARQDFRQLETQAALHSIWILLLIAHPAAAAPQSASTNQPGGSLRGEISVLTDWLPRKDATELRSEVRVEAERTIRPWLRIHADAALDALAADRAGAAADAFGRVNDVWIELTGARGDLRAGFGRVVWGRLDEVQPSDVINPIDAARFILMGRSEARRAVALVRGRLFASERFTLEGVLAPVFRRGTFDELEEPSSPFNLERDLVLPAFVELSGDVVHQTPASTWKNVSGGARAAATFGRFDVAGSVYRGFDAFGILSFEPASVMTPGPTVVGSLVERYSRFTMLGADFETVTGDWVWRGELAAFVEKRLAAGGAPDGVDGRVLEAGFGVDRRAGDYRVFGSIVTRREWSDQEVTVNRTNVNLVGSIERSLGRDRYRIRVFGVVNPGDAATFLRGVLSWNLQDNVAIEGSAAAFLGTSDDALGRFKERDFLFARLRYWF